MPDALTDTDIQRLVSEEKMLPSEYEKRLQLKSKRGHKEAELDVVGTNGSEFRLILRQSEFNPLDFSVILAYQMPNSNQLFRLRRYNGKSHEHTNKLEGTTFYDFHIHQATERYQDSGFREDTYAEPTKRFSDVQGALRLLFEDCNFKKSSSGQPTFFDEGA